VVALANLLPADAEIDELDSYMYQTVGHQLVEAYAECTGLPLIRRRIQGSARNQVSCRGPSADPGLVDQSILVICGVVGNLRWRHWWQPERATRLWHSRNPAPM
jgi:hypothetical protein